MLPIVIAAALVGVLVFAVSGYGCVRTLKARLATQTGELAALNERLQAEAAEQARLADRFARLNACFLSFEPDPQTNIQRITDLCGDLLNATCALYNRREDPLLCTLAHWQAPPDYQAVDRAEGHICYDVIRTGADDPFIQRNLLRSPYAESDPNVRQYNLQTYIGQAVRVGSDAVGSLCVVYQDDYEPTPADLQLLGILARALGVEEARRQATRDLRTARDTLEARIQARTADLQATNDQLRREVAERRRAEEAYGSSEARLRIIFEKTPVGIAMVRSGGFIEQANPAFVDLVGRAPETLHGMNYAEFTHADDLERERDYVGLLHAGAIDGYRLEKRYLRPDGSSAWVDFTVSVLRDVDGAITFALAAAQDISARKMTEAALEASEQRLRGIFEHIPVGLALAGTDNLLQVVNPAMADMLGYSIDEMQLLSHADFTHPDDLAIENAYIDELLAGTRTGYDMEKRLTRKDGTQFWGRVTAGLIHAEDGTVLYGVGTLQDITARKATEQALRTSEERFRTIIEQSTDSIRLLDETGCIIEWNPASEQLTGLRRDDVLGRPFWDVAAQLVPPEFDANEQRDRFEQMIRAMLHGGDIVQLPIHETPGMDGVLRHLRTRLFPIRTPDGTRIGAITRDITDVIQAQAALSLSEERYRTIARAITEFALVYRVEPDGRRFVEWSTEAADRFLVLNPDGEFTMETLHVHAEDLPAMRQMAAALMSRQPQTLEFRVADHAGTWYWLQGYWHPEWSEAEQRVVRVYATAQDITARKEAELALRASEERHRIVTEIVSDYTFAYRVEPDQTQVIEWVSASLQSMFGWQAGTRLDHRTQQQMIHPDDRATTQALVEAVHRGETQVQEYRVMFPEQGYRWLRAYWRPEWDAAGRVVRVYVAAQDITARKEAETALRLSEERHRILSEIISDYAVAFRIDGDDAITAEWVSGPLRDNARLPKNTPLGVDDLRRNVYPADRAIWTDNWHAVLRGESRQAEYRIQFPGDQVRWLRAYWRPAWDDDEARVVRAYVAAQDITARKEAETALRLSEERHRIIAESISDFAITYRLEADDTLVLEWATAAARQILRLDAGGIIDPNILYRAVHPDDWPRLLRNMELVHAGESVIAEFQLVIGDVVPRWLLGFWRAVPDDDPTIRMRVFFAAQDITARKQAEEQRLALHLERERSLILSGFIQDVTHEFANPLSVIKTGLYLMEHTADGAQRAQRGQEIKGQVFHVEQLVRGMTTMAQLDGGVEFLFEPVPVQTLVNTVLDSLGLDIERKELQVTTDMPAVTLLIDADAYQIQTALGHIVQNAVSFTPHQGTITITVERDHDNVIIAVEDTGIGIDDDHLPLIFNRFYRVDPSRSQRGAGLGLAIARVVVERHFGHIVARSVLGEGSTFTIILPLLLDDD